MVLDGIARDHRGREVAFAVYLDKSTLWCYFVTNVSERIPLVLMGSKRTY